MAISPEQCQVMISFNDSSAGREAEQLANLLNENGIATFCTRLYCPQHIGEWRQNAVVKAVNHCKIYIPLMTNAWQKSVECQDETRIARNLQVKDKLVVLPVRFEDFDDEYDRNHHFYCTSVWSSVQMVYKQNNPGWMKAVLKLVQKPYVVATLACSLDPLEAARKKVNGFTPTHREWVFNRIGEWCMAKKWSRAFVLKGSAGMGKSVISTQHFGCGNVMELFAKRKSWIGKRLSRSTPSTVVGAAHFFDHANANTSQLKDVFTSIANQLSKHVPGLAAVLKTKTAAKVAEQSQHGNTTVSQWFEILIEEPCSSVSVPPHRIMIIFDAQSRD